MSSENSSLLHNNPTTNERPWWFKYALAGGAVVVVGGIVWVATATGKTPVAVVHQSGDLGLPNTTLPATTTAVPTTTVEPTTTAAPTTTATTAAPTTTAAKSTPLPTSDTIVAPDATHPPQFAEFFKDFNAKLDPSTNPCDNFYQYACGGWLNATTLSESDTTIDSSFYVIGKDNEKIIKSILDSKPDVIDPFYQACLKETDVNPDAVIDLSLRLNQIGDVQNVDDLLTYAGKLATEFNSAAFFDVGVGVDPKNSTLNALQLSQGGLTLPSIEYYAADKVGNYVAALDAYLKSLEKVEAFQKVPASTILDFEGQLAKISLSQAQLRDPWATYHKFSLTEVLAKYPLVASYLRGANGALLNQAASIPVIVPTPTFFDALEKLLRATDLNVLKSYLRFKAIHARSTLLGEFFRQANHDFSGVLQGQASKEPRDQYCVSLTQNLLGEYLGKLFMDKVFDDATKQQAKALIKQIEDSMVVVLNNDTWLDESTRRVGLEKVAEIGNFIGGPDVIQKLPFNIYTSFYKNLNNFNSWTTNKTWDSLHQPVDHTKWDMFAYTVNAYNDPSANKIVFPAAILQPPFYNAKGFPSVVNYARIGMVMGHELTHGFDDEGRNFDPKGQLKSWWTDAVGATFEKNAKCLADHYSTFPIVSDIDGKTVLGHLNGQLTLGENIADNGGLKLAYMAYQRAKQADPSIASIGYDDAKLYFTAFAQGWCQKRSDGNAILRMNTDPHSPGKWRVHGPLLNSQAFADAFQCPVGSPMNPAKKCVVW